MSEVGKAVFLSYASQDAEAARRICEALRGAGVEVWFDAEGGLEHGDEWDAKIRRQIKECVLFIAVISHNTQAREEGYFRIEWELAAERAMGIASGVAFILPVVIDDTREPDALVPDRFRKVQWTRVPGGVVAPEVRARLLKLWSHRAGAIAHTAAGSGEMETGRPRPAVPVESPAAPPRARSSLVWGSVGAALVAVAVLGWWWSRPAVPAGAGAAPVAKTATASADGKLSEAQQLSARAYVLTQKVGFQREDLATAEELTRKATELEPASARAWGVRAWVQAAYLNRNWDRSPQRREDAQKFANRALALDAKEADALNALGQVLTSQGAYAEAEVIGRRAVAADPDNVRSRLMLGRAIMFQDRDAEAREVLAEAVRREPGHLLARYELANSYAGIGQSNPKPGEVEQAVAHLDAALRVQEFGSALLVKAMLVGARLGNFTEMRALLDAMDRLSPAERSEDRAVFVAMWTGLLEGRPERVLAAAARTARTFFDDAIVASPKAWGTALAYQQAGKTATARIEWQAAETVLRQRLRESSSPQRETAMLAITLAWQDRSDEAKRELAPIETLWKEQMGPGSARWLAMCHAGLGDAARAVPYLRLAINRMNLITDHTLMIDPWWQKLRGKPEFEALVAEAKARIASGLGGVASVGAAAGAPIGLTPAAGVVSPARALITKALALIRQVDATREDVALAEDYCQQAMKLDATDAEVWAVYSEVHGTFIYRGWDATPERREQSRVMAERAIRLAPRSVEARLAQAGAWTTFGVNRPESEKLLREVLVEQPGNQHVFRFLASVVLSQDRLDEALALMDRSAALPGGDPLALYNKARALWARNRPEEAAAALDASLAQGPIASALTMKALVNLNWRGDLEAAAAAIRQLPGSALLEDRANYLTGLLHFYQRNPAQALAAWSAFPREFYDDFQFSGPKSQLLGDAHELANRPEAAKAEWRVALQAVEKRLALKPTDRTLLLFKAELLASLGEKAAAEAALRTAQELSGRQFTARTPMSWWQARIYVRLGRVDELLEQLPLSLANPVASGIRAAALRLDPRFDALRGDPRFLKLIEAPARNSAP